MNATTIPADQSAIAQAASLGLFFDTETTGIPEFHKPSEDPCQPHIVQLAAKLVDLDTRQTLETLDLIIRPDGWIIPPETIEVHGITMERAMDEGVPEEEALERFWTMWAKRHRIAHNEQFDQRILRIGLKRYFDIRNPDLEVQPSDEWKAGTVECTARMTTKICNLPPTAAMVRARRNHPKTPKLTEAYLHFFGREMEGAHNALNDVDGCMAVYFAVKDMQREAVPA
ncbi:MAG: 3'-5' exonuclease [Aquabacterium sp.]|uniref:3'-5' exonuclease n=1 Tax=Aquabacterium sp. TaxID=1872578 RepID=UPI003BB21FE5